ncbi:MAG TPA: Crp/Fnr family transcriptional regulator [Bacillota bacterium]|nr:Crp/Fnr family transcriptional regulator [Bacillota bacterium]
MKNEVQNIPIFQDIDTHILDELIEKRLIFTSSYRKGITVHNQHDPCDNLDIILSGSLIAYSLSQSGSATTMFEFRKGSILGENLLLGASNAYPLNIFCLTDCEIVHVAREAVLELLHDYHFVMRFIRSISQNSQGMNQKIKMLTQKTLRENLMEYLKKQSIVQKSPTIILPVSKKQLADYLGVQRPSLFRELKKLCDENIIVIQNKKITLLAE